jgi:hypothetical protein
MERGDKIRFVDDKSTTRDALFDKWLEGDLVLVAEPTNEPDARFQDEETGPIWGATRVQDGLRYTVIPETTLVDDGPEEVNLLECVLPAVRYAMGRRSYAVSDMCDIVRKTHWILPNREALRGFVADALAQGQQGDMCDHQQWVDLLAHMEGPYKRTQYSLTEDEEQSVLLYAFRHEMQHDLPTAEAFLQQAWGQMALNTRKVAVNDLNWRTGF